VFRNLEGQLLDGIESMLREPYGCFEQTSSATYPNIYVLKYLKHAGKSNPTIEKKAMDYIRTGYKRLVGYETEENGFEWFGKTPPHAALTAYGLLEFTDMQEFIPVDKNMLERTKSFLLSRRDGKGGFFQNSNGYDQFAAVPGRIANIYIVYSLTQAGIGKEIRLEYETALNKAFASNDVYLLSMMALAAHNMNDSKGYNRLMEAAKKLYREKGGVAETSVVNSRDASLRVETISLYSLALLRDPAADLAEVANLLSKILAEKTYYGYGATQATVLALQAIVEYSKRIGSITDNMDVNFMVNQQKIGEGGKHEKWIREGENTFHVAYSNEKKTAPYTMEVAYFTFTPPNSEKAELSLQTVLKEHELRVGETSRMQISVTNTKSVLQPMAMAKIGIPAGLSLQPWQLKELTEKNRIAYYEIFDHYLVFYWMGFAANETKTVNLDLKAEIAGTYKGKASNTYLYYTPEHKHWAEGLEVIIKQ
jgi:uncharacterized protein YfaS (alpha-2-macroglobulin family)